MKYLEKIERIPYKVWASSQLSIAKYSGGITINGKQYVLDYDNCPTKIDGGDIKYFPDLVLFSSLPKKKSTVTKKAKPINILSLFSTHNEYN